MEAMWTANMLAGDSIAEKHNSFCSFVKAEINAESRMKFPTLVLHSRIVHY